MFSIITQRWMKPFIYPSEIVEIYRNHGKEKNITVLFADQTITVIKQIKQVNTSEDQEPWVEDKTCRLQIEDEIIGTHQDREDNKFIAFITKKKGDAHKDEFDAHHHHSYYDSHDMSLEHNVHQSNYGIHILYETKLYDISDMF